MNDLTTLDHLGPAPTPLSRSTLAAARARLDLATAQPQAASRDRSPRVLILARRPIFAAAAAAAVTIGLAVAPALVGERGSVAVAAVDPMTFPWSPGTLPSGLGEPVFEKELDLVAARYGEPLDGIAITTEVAERESWTVPAGARSVEVNGEEATLFEHTVHDGSAASAPAVVVLWRDDAHDWTAVSGSGQYADADRVLAFAESLVDRPQPVHLRLGVAPEGWSVVSYKEDRIVTLSASGEPENDDLTVMLTDRLSSDLAGYGAREESMLVVHDRPALLGRQVLEGDEFRWILEAHTEDGRTFALQAPGSLTRDQVVAVAEGVTHTP